MKLQTLSLIAGLFFSISAFSQQTKSDAVKGQYEISEMDTLENIIEEVTSDSLLSNDETFYNNIWNSTQIKYPLNTLPPKEEMITVRLTEPFDHPYVQPAIGKMISKFGRRGRRMHTGTDIKINSGDSILCAFDGRVRLAKRFSGYGNLVLVRHKNGLETIYAHLSAIKVNVNDSIRAGDLIGLGGRTGRATCDHLHFETRLFGEPFDSNKYIDFNRYALRSNHIYYKNKQVELAPEDFNKKPVIENRPPIAEKAGTIVKVTPHEHTATVAKASAKAKTSKHVIRKGDNLWVIAKKYNTSVKKLCTTNNITAQKTLKVGSVLRIN